jgi:Family of unknown function (DUF6011)
VNIQALSQYSRVILTKRSETCRACGTPTVSGRDYAAVTADRQWHAYCAPCAASYAAQAAGLTKRLEALAETCQAAGISIDDLPLPDEARLIAVMQDAGSSFGYDVTQALFASIAVLHARQREAASAADPILVGLRAVAANAGASARDRGFAQSLIDYHGRRGALTENQRTAAERMLGKVNGGSATTYSPGVYVDPAGRIIKVQANRAGTGVYTKLWMGNGWDFQPALLATKGMRPITADEAAAFGHEHDHCVFCGLSLSDDKANRSVEVGYGPVCAEKYNLPWG